MKYTKLLITVLLMLVLCGCSSTEDFTAPDYTVVEKPDELTAQTIDGYRTPSSAVTSEETVSIYYANKNSKKFHKPECKYAQKMNETSVLLEKEREILISNGYSPCSICQP